MTEYWRQKLTDRFGPEIVVKCCRLHKGHYNGGKWGNCGLCGQKPVMVNMTWDQVDEEQAARRASGDV